MPRYGHLAIHPYPTELEREMTLKTGEMLLVRPIRPEDAAMEIAFVESLTQETRRMRFQSALRTLTPAMLARFTQIDYDREMALVAIEGAPGAEREVAVCRYVSLPDARSCEFAIVVADPWQRRGLGRRLMRRLIAIARDRGLVRMEGWVLAGNAPMLRMCAELGFTDHAVPGDPATRRVSLDF
jgi:acetyltransferase